MPNTLSNLDSIMELGAALIIVSVILAAPCSLFVVLKYGNSTQNNKKKQKKEREDTLQSYVSQEVRDLQEVFTAKENQYKETITSLQKSNARYQGLIKKYKDQLLDVEEDEDDIDIEKDYDIDWIKAAQVGQQFGLDTSKFDPNNPVLTSYIKDKILENKDLALFMGILKPKGSNTGNNQPGTNNQNSGQSSIFDTPEAQSFASL